ncbi:TetR/AcrR family transcriptional regulator [Oligoflexus tunisiensis]|uniref:TetR/AcrR family transcriptional regulator n=1 Tax=Oligoflexus tunisiensis TaxID=708132 RepID=UPI000AE125A6|nr:TetR/AcrR family transcriptional regulator [Oligoflexus tunisiensis]
MGKSRKTRDAIIQGSIELFNQMGVADISTNHIASHLDISPGNLYYYFPNKEAIIRAIYERIRTQLETLYGRDQPPLLQLSDYVNVCFQIIFEYRFFFSELPMILRRDAELRTDYVQLQARFKEELAGLICGLSQVGILVSLDGQDRRMALANSIWIVTIYWHSYLESAPPISPPAPSRELLKHILFLLTPYIAPEFQAAVQGIFSSFMEARGHDSFDLKPE